MRQTDITKLLVNKKHAYTSFKLNKHKRFMGKLDLHLLIQGLWLMQLKE